MVQIAFRWGGALLIIGAVLLTTGIVTFPLSR